MKRRKTLFVVAGVMLSCALVFAVVYFAYPRMLLRSGVALQRSAAGFSHRWIEVNRWQLPYIDSHPQGNADRPTILFVHGFGDTKDRFIDLADKLTDNYRVVALDLPGFGETAIRMDEDFDAALYVRCIIEFVDKLELGPVHLVGYSMGGGLAAKAAVDSPEKFRTLTLLAPAGLPGARPSELDQIIARSGEIPLVYRDRQSLDRLLELNFNKTPDLPDFVLRAILAEGIERADLHEHIFRRLFNPDDVAAFEGEVAAIEIPTLLIWGQDDRILDVSARIAGARSIPPSVSLSSRVWATL